MAAAAPATPKSPPHIPVLIRPLIGAVSPVNGVWLDGTFGAGGYACALLEAGAEKVIGVDRDPSVFELAAAWAGEFGETLQLVQGTFGALDEIASDLDGIVLDLGVSSMQLDQAERGFSFMKDGPLDMRMGTTGPSAADIVNGMEEADLADILFQFGEERASRRIARRIVSEREQSPITTTRQLALIVEKCLPRAKPNQSHPATRSFQAIRIAVNDEFGELIAGLEAAERALKPGGKLAVVSFHSLEDRIVKRFLQQRASSGGGGSRYAPERAEKTPAFKLLTKAVGPDEQELAENPRSRSAKLRVALRTDAPAELPDRRAIALPGANIKGLQ